MHEFAKIIQELFFEYVYLIDILSLKFDKLVKLKSSQLSPF